MTIYGAFHWIYFLIHLQWFLESIPGRPACEWWEYVLGFLVMELSGHLAICCMNWLLKKSDAQPPAKPTVPDMSKMEVEILRYTATLRNITSQLEMRINLLDRENRQLEAELQARQEAAFRRGNSDL